MLMTLMIHPNVLRASAIGEHEEKPFMVLSVLTSVLSNDLPQSAANVTAATSHLPIRPTCLLAWPPTNSFVAAGALTHRYRTGRDGRR